jgi:hypothetical protein
VTLPVIERIANTLVERLQAITIANGYDINIAAVGRLNRLATNITAENHAIWVIQGDTIPNDEQTHEGNPIALGKTTTWNVHIFVRQSDSDMTPYSTNVNIASAAAQLAIRSPAVAPHMWHTMDGDAVMVEFGTESPMLSAEGEQSGVTIPVNVTYRVSEDDPTEARS